MKNTKKPRISISYMLLAVLTAMVCSGLFRPVLFQSVPESGISQEEQADARLEAKDSLVVGEGIVPAEDGDETGTTGAYTDVYHYLDTLQPVGHRTLQTVQTEPGIYDMFDEEDGTGFTVLQLTDIHLTGTEAFYKKDILAVDTVYTMIERTHPDLIVITGDLIFGRDGYAREDGLRAWNVFSNLMDTIQIPWIWTFGNHDHSFFDAFTEEETRTMLSQCQTLYQCHVSGLSGFTNGMVRLKTAGGALCSALISLDSHNERQKEDGTPGGYDYVKPDQIDWYEQQIRSLKSTYGEEAVSMVFLHIPVEEYKTAWEAVQKNSEEAEYIEGSRNEIVSCSAVQTQLFEKALALGSTRAFFCGHDHLNNDHLIYRGIHLIYGKSIDYVAYPGIELLTKQRGATLIGIDLDGRFSVRQLRMEDFGEE